MYHWLKTVDRWPRRNLLFLLPIIIVITAALDYVTGYEFAFAIFYLLPVSLTAYAFGKRAGLAVSFLCACIWGYMNLLAGETYTYEYTMYWNEFTRFGFFGFTTILLCDFHDAMKKQQLLARTDPLSGLLNRRAFYEEIESELLRMTRYKHPFALVYTDLDKFKAINDRLGHHVGDEVIITTAKVLTEQTRQLDVVARLGGDEFSLLLPQTDVAQAQVLVSRLQTALRDAMAARDWPVTPSIGVYVVEAPLGVDEIIKAADELMYKVKRHGGDDIQFDTHNA